MIKPFLCQIASRFYDEYGADVGDMAFVFPNRRSGLFFHKYLAEAAGKPLFSPALFTINDLFVQLSGRQLADRIGMLFTLHNIYAGLIEWEEPFDDFVYWGEMLLNDFDDVDKYMADARMLFTNVTDLKDIDLGYGYLSDNQIAAIRSFWASFNPKSSNPSRQNFRAVWQILYRLYLEFREALAAEGKGYEGMIFRQVAEQLDRDDPGIQLPPYSRWIFVGLNALSVAEERLLRFFRRRGLGDFYWDYASEMVRDPDNKASFFAAANMRNFPSAFPLPSDAALPDPSSIDVIGIPSAIGQARQVHAILDELARKGEMSEAEAMQTAVVLPDEHLLIPVLNAIPESVAGINVTMGYPPDGTPVAALMDFITALQKNMRYADGQPFFYLRDVLTLLNHRYIAATDPEAVAALAGDLAMNKRMLVAASSLAATDFLACLFAPIEQAEQASDYLLQILKKLYDHAIEMEREFIHHYHTRVSRMKDLMRQGAVDMSLPTYFRLLRRLTALISIPFEGEPLAGLQIMGILETRALDFERIIILSMNEGIFPQKRAASSFIPYNLRRGFGLPTYEHQDSIRAYHFYRLIHRARHITLIYDSRSNGLNTGEMSRFIHQLRYHYGMPLQTKWVMYNPASFGKSSLSISKSPEVMRQLGRFRPDGDRSISASALNTWISCPLQFYFTVIENLREEEELTDAVDSGEFGSILHKVMEDLYRPLCNASVTADILHLIRKDTATLTESIRRNFHLVRYRSDSGRPLAGQDYLAGEMIRKYADKILETDARRFTPFLYISSEMRLGTLISLPDGSQVRLKGFIDRIDRVDGRIRIVDYKTGQDKLDFSTIESLFNPSEKDRRKAVMQVFMYAMMYDRLAAGGSTAIAPAVYSMRSIFSDDFNPCILMGSGRGKERLDDIRPLLESFEESLALCLHNIFSPDVPFTRALQPDACTWCGFRELCNP
ncbi:MAG: PD-(D/E)XK nuclease family protein [Tannerellaceae bacterium]|jgi:RecB family exonuclease|nr:PD-(D/E)XK nuclease family protein [Tannerellaceae bacterium]